VVFVVGSLASVRHGEDASDAGIAEGSEGESCDGTGGAKRVDDREADRGRTD
jgi:hypothetical protein